jgi:hypothetical protein
LQRGGGTNGPDACAILGGGIASRFGVIISKKVAARVLNVDYSSIDFLLIGK